MISIDIENGMLPDTIWDEETAKQEILEQRTERDEENPNPWFRMATDKGIFVAQVERVVNGLGIYYKLIAQIK